MKPHEETWPHGSVIVCMYDAQKGAREKLAIAAPAMARALMALLCQDGGCPRPECVLARAALKEAGVIE